MSESSAPISASSNRLYDYFVLFLAGLGGLLYGIDIGIIDPALGYLGKTMSLTEEQKSVIVAAVLGGSMLSSVIAGFFADLLGRKIMMIISAIMFIASVGIIFTSQSYYPLLSGRVLQGMSGGVIAVVVPLYLAECLRSDSRGRGTSIFQFMLTFGIVIAAIIGSYYTENAESAIKAAVTPEDVVAAANHAWRSMFLTVAYPGILFLLGCFFISESPRWLYRNGRTSAARASMLRSRTTKEADLEIGELEHNLIQERSKEKISAFQSLGEIFSQRKYIVPFILACLILGSNQATGVNSILGFMTTILQQAGLNAQTAADSGLWIKILNTVMTVVAVIFVDLKGRKFLLKMGTAGIIAALAVASITFYSFESKRTNVLSQVQQQVSQNALRITVNHDTATNQPTQLTVMYAYGHEEVIVDAFSNQANKNVINITPPQGVTEPLTILRARSGPIPSETTGYVIAGCLAFFMAFFAAGPGVCVWLALSELMPTRIRSVGMGVALLINQGVSTTIAAVFLPIVGNYGYFAMFAFWGACTVIYFIIAAFFLPETKGKTLEEIEDHFAR
jgi:SP family myo-inositol transporter-like MFS transporter 13